MFSFDENFGFWRKFLFLNKMLIFKQNFDLWHKFWFFFTEILIFFIEIFICEQNFDFLTEILIVDRNFTKNNFWGTH